MNICPSCGAEMRPESRFCTKCKTKLQQHTFNYCENPECIRCRKKHEFQADDICCDLCGEPTTLGKEVENHL